MQMVMIPRRHPHRGRIRVAAYIYYTTKQLSSFLSGLVNNPLYRIS